MQNEGYIKECNYAKKKKIRKKPTKEQLAELKSLEQRLRLPPSSPPETYEKAERIILEIKASWGE